MALSMENRHLLERKLGKAIPARAAKITLAMDALDSILDAARRDERARRREPSLFEQVFGEPFATK